MKKNVIIPSIIAIISIMFIISIISKKIAVIKNDEIGIIDNTEIDEKCISFDHYRIRLESTAC